MNSRNRKAMFANRIHVLPESQELWESQSRKNRLEILSLGGMNKPKKFNMKDWNELTLPQKVAYSNGIENHGRKMSREQEMSGRI